MITKFCAHTDLDGISWLVALQYYFPELTESEIVIVDYKLFEQNKIDIDSLLDNCDKQIWIDFTPPVEVLQKMIERKLEVLVFDHHKSSIDKVTDILIGNDNIATYFDIENNNCGSMLFYNWCKQNSKMPVLPNLEYFINLVNVYDTWKCNDPLFERAVDLNRLLYKKMIFELEGIDKYAPFLSTICESVFETPMFEYSKLDKEIIEKDRNIEKTIMISCCRSIRFNVDSKGIPFGVVMIEKKMSIVAYRLLLKFSDRMKYLIIINTYKPDELTMSLRSLKSSNFDVTTLEGVQGHAEAGGYKCESFIAVKRKAFLIWTKKINGLGYKISN